MEQAENILRIARSALDRLDEQIEVLSWNNNNTLHLATLSERKTLRQAFDVIDEGFERLDDLLTPDERLWLRLSMKEAFPPEWVDDDAPSGLTYRERRPFDGTSFWQHLREQPYRRYR